MSELEKLHQADRERLEELQLQMRESTAEFLKRIKDLEYKLERADDKKASSSSSDSDEDKDKIKDMKKKLKQLEDDHEKCGDF